MAITEAETSEELRQEFDELEEQIKRDEQERKGAAAGWLFSICVHGVVVLLLSAIIFAQNFTKEPPPIRIVMMETPPPPPKPPVDRDIVENNQVVIETEEVTSEVTIVSDIDLPVEEITTEEPNPSEMNEARGREDAMSDSEMGQQGAFSAIGPGGGAKGAFGRVTGGDRRSIGRAFGPNARGVITTMDAALMWLVRHQSPNGQWDSDGYWSNCEDIPKMEPGKQVNGADEALTGYALLCFLGAGYDHKTPNKYRRTVQRGIEWILSIQQQDGVIGRRNYEHPVATMALAEAYAMTNDPALREPTQRAVNIILQRQVQDTSSYPLGWDYVEPKLSRMDSSVTGWNVMALKSAKAGGLDIGQGLEGSRRWLEGAWKAANPNWERLSDPYNDKTIFPYTWNGENNSTNKDHLSFVGVMCSVFLGENQGSIMMESMANDMTDRWFNGNKYRQNSYALYYASLGAFQVGGKHWEQTWGHPQNGYAPWLIETNIKDENAGCRRGTWNHAQEGWHGSDTSPVLLHTYKLLALEVAIRYESIIKRNR